MREPIIGAILAGGLSRRMGGGDKGLRHLGGRSILQRTIDRLRPQVASLFINANGDPARLDTDLAIVPDNLPDQPGPLAGILAGLDHIAAMQSGRWLLSVPADCPFLPSDLALRLQQGLQGASAVCAASNGQIHPVIGLWSIELRDSLHRQLVEREDRRVEHWVRSIPANIVEWNAAPYDPFLNINTPADLEQAERLLTAYPGA